MLKTISILLSGIFLTTLGCNSYSPKNQGAANSGNSSQGAQAGYAVPTYDFVYGQVIKPYCVSCHTNAGGNPKGVNLETYSAFMQNIALIQSVALVTKIMPPSAPLPAFAQNILQQWIKGGAPQNGVPLPSSPQPPPPPAEPPAPPVSATYTSLNNEIFSTKCVSCHGEGGPASQKPLENYADVIKFGEVKPGSPSTSTLYTITKSGQMPPGDPLSADELKAISDWILSGAKNN